MSGTEDFKMLLPAKCWKWVIDRRIRFFLSYPIAVLTIFTAHLLTHFVFHPQPIFKVTLLVSLTVIISLSLGFGPGVLSAFLTGVIIDYFCIYPKGVAVKPFTDYLFILAFITPSLLVSALVATLRLALRKVSVSERKAQRALGDRDILLKMVAHDLRNPLTSIMLNCQLALRSKRETLELEKLMKSVGTAGQHMNLLIQNLLDASKIHDGKFNISKRDGDLIALISGLLFEFQPLADKGQISVTFDKEVSVARASFDEEGISQVISNILGNALKFTPPGGAIGIKVKMAPHNKFVVEISDSGCGIESGSLPYIFDFHWQGRGRAKSGLGLGLYIARAIVRAHGNDIQVRSKINSGTRFSFFVDGVSEKSSVRNLQVLAQSLSLG